jgi:hypothetical protein
VIALSDTDSFSHAVAGNKATLIIRDSYGAVRDSFDVVVPFGAYAASGAFVFAEVNGVDTITALQSFCFMAGTMIGAPDGEAPVETLKRGDLVMTVDGEAKPVSWIGRQTVFRRFSHPLRNWPVRVAAGALGENIPARDLLLSPDHALRVGGVLANAGALVNGTSIRRETRAPETFVYYHVELEDHALILAENAPAETFLDAVDRLGFDNWEEHLALYPEGRTVRDMPYPRAKARRQLGAEIRAMLDARANAIGGEDGERGGVNGGRARRPGTGRA